jgi:hypothetical protein
MTFAPGQSGNLNGRPSGARNKRTQEILDLIKASGHKDPLLALSELVSSSKDEAVVAQASSMLAPYLHSKLASKPTPPDPVYVEQALNLPAPSTIRQAYENIAQLSHMKAQGQLDIATATSLIEDQKVILYALIDEAKLLTVQGGAPEQTIFIEGGLPALPGTNITMPPARMNGKDAIDPDPNFTSGNSPQGQEDPGQGPPPGSTEP